MKKILLSAIMGNQFLDFISSMKLAIGCLSAAVVLVFAGTLAQVNFGAYVVQERFFQSWLVWWPSESIGFPIPVFPGGHLLGAVLLVNLLAVHLHRFRLIWHHVGIHLIHGGLIMMLAGGLFTDWFSVESQMLIAQGETKNYSEDIRRVELVFVDDTNEDRILTIPEARLCQGEYAASDSLDMRLVSQGGAAAQSFSFKGAHWHLEMRPIRYYKPYSITLQKLIDERYPGTDIPKNFASQITLIDPAHAVNRDVVISMNHPFRYAGETYYQSGFSKEAQSSMIAVVRNPAFVSPYVASAVMGLGLLIQFCQRFVGFTRRANDLRIT